MAYCCGVWGVVEPLPEPLLLEPLPIDPLFIDPLLELLEFPLWLLLFLCFLCVVDPDWLEVPDCPIELSELPDWPMVEELPELPDWPMLPLDDPELPDWPMLPLDEPD